MRRGEWRGASKLRPTKPIEEAQRLVDDALRERRVHLPLERRFLRAGERQAVVHALDLHVRRVTGVERVDHVAQILVLMAVGDEVRRPVEEQRRRVDATCCMYV